MSELKDRLSSALASRYTIRGEIGRGGMAVVYLASDLKHERDVAVKCLLPDLAATLGSDRFLQEIRVTANLQHPHILPLYDSGEADGLLYYVMPYVEGESLRQRLNRDRRLSVPEVVRITEQVASALDYAHRHGVLHRDIKPENIMISESHAIVADFGIAKAISTAGGENLTRSGFPLGTPGYMSPEQAASLGVLDQSTDVYSLACVVYEMLVGDTPGEWPTEEAVTLGRFVDALPEHREQLDTLPGRLEQVLVKGLATQRRQRFAKPLQLTAALRAVSQSSEKLSEAEMQRIMSRAAELDAEHPTEEPQLSIGALEQVAAEVGIPPERVREAARELERPSDWSAEMSPKISNFFGVPTGLAMEHVIEGEVSEADYPLLVKEIHAGLGIVGHTSTLGRSLTWSPAESGGMSRRIQISVSSEAGRTWIRIRERLDLAGDNRILPYLMAIGGGIVAALLGASFGLGDSALIVVPSGLGGVLGYNITARTLYSRAYKRRKPQLEALSNRLAAVARSLATASTEVAPRLSP
ncbi:MAG: serine/threonine protein kinase [Gemmatimonadota bacterium]|nr:MAG: serine/threonine protein kinase [Gemmatimonadota bacterium]